MAILTTDIPARLDRLPFAAFHRRVVIALGVTWVLDGLEVTLAGTLASALQESPVMQFDPTDIGLANGVYLAGAVLGALLFGQLADRFGRKKLFTVTLLVYLLATAATGFSWNLASFAFFRFFTGAGIGGEYAAINSAIQELIPARLRGRVDLAVNGSFWAGAALGAIGSLTLLSPATLGVELGWRACFLIGALLGLIVLFLRRHLPESPRWLMTHGRGAEAHAVVDAIERDIAVPLQSVTTTVRLHDDHRATLADAARSLFVHHRKRALVALALMSAQAFFYNAIFFSWALVLTKFYGVSGDAVGWYLLPFCVGNVAGPLLLGPLFDQVGRRKMISATYALSGILLLIVGVLFARDLFSPIGLAVGLAVVFFVASAAASSAYLTVGETFPLEIRALTIAIFYAGGTGLGGIAAPVLFGRLVAGGERSDVFFGYALGSVLMLLAAGIVVRWGVDAERRSLEDVTRPLSHAAE
ncbi:MFS transporter [Roseiterribacter gracilis]|uniref:MFS transporter n=1 Tax=Roseiterribacter gracilis TaxID=2812848 RepID=A0A8S8XB07_9PROT|nr:MFS transporter [Rhodospirillales bacterium TMPK1]